jgi:hypothetical protein
MLARPKTLHWELFAPVSMAMVFLSAAAAVAGDPRVAPSRRLKAKANDLAGTSSGPAIRSSPFAPGAQSDSRFVVDTAPGALDTGCSFLEDGPLKFTIEVNRVVGDVTSTGELLSPDQLVANGVVSQFALLRLPAFDVDSEGDPIAPERDHIRFNGKDIGPDADPMMYLTGKNNAWVMDEFRIPISMVRFGTMNTVNGTPDPGLNEITIDIDVLGGGWCTAIDWAELSFQALAPVIMVHGNTSNGAFFSDAFRLVPDATGAFVPRPVPGFTAPFISTAILYDNSINMPNNTIAAHGAFLQEQWPIIAAQFGATHAHIVAHSKGGLDSRDALARLGSQMPQLVGPPQLPNFGVLSLTTMSTPHHGSVGADYGLDAQNASVGISSDVARTLLAQFQPVQGPDLLARMALRTSAVKDFNATNQLPESFWVNGDDKATNVAYLSLGTDASFDRSVPPSTFGYSFDEANGSGYPPPICDFMYSLVGNVASTTLAPVNYVVPNPSGGDTQVIGFGVSETRTTSFQLNDYLVTIHSSRLVNDASSSVITPFRDVGDWSFDPPDNQSKIPPANHGTVASPSVGQIVIDAIRKIQPIQPPYTMTVCQ